MILTKSEQTRQFVGRLDLGAELVSTLLEACRQHQVACGELRGSGYLRRARLVHYDPTTHQTTVPETWIQGPLALGSVHATISQQDGDTSVHLHAVLVEPGGRCWAGQIAEAEVISFEFVITTFDDIVLIRGNDRSTGLDQWLQLRAPGEPPATREDGHRRAAPESQDDDVGDDVDEVMTRPGDILEHPRFGRCVVVNQPDEERISVRLENQRTVDLHLGLVRLSVLRREGAATVYKARILRKQ